MRNPAVTTAPRKSSSIEPGGRIGMKSPTCASTIGWPAESSTYTSASPAIAPAAARQTDSSTSRRDDPLRARADGAQDRHLAPALVERGVERDQHAQQSHQHDEDRHHPEPGLGVADPLPHLVQRQTGDDRHHRLVHIVVDLALKPEHVAAVGGPHEERRHLGDLDLLHREHVLARLLFAGHGRRAVLPSESGWPRCPRG